MNSYFPHYTRIITAAVFRFMLILLYFVATLLVIISTTFNYHTIIFPENEEYSNLKINTLLYPKNKEDILTFANYLNTHGLKKEAATLKEQFVLGENTNTTGNLTNIDYWNKVTDEKPEFRDGFIQLAALYYQNADFEKSEQSLNKALEIDPLYLKLSN